MHSRGEGLYDGGVSGLAPWRRLLAYRGALEVLASRSLKLRYRRSVLGFAWTLAYPALATAVLAVVFSRVFTQVNHYAAYVVVGVLAWHFFSVTCSQAMDALLDGASVMRKVYVPSAVFPLAAVVANLVNLLLCLAVLPTALTVFGAGGALRPLAFAAGIIGLVTFTAGAALALAALNLFFRDVRYFFEAILLLWFYATPVVYPEDALLGGARLLLWMNPLYWILDALRAGLCATAIPSAGALWLSLLRRRRLARPRMATLHRCRGPVPPLLVMGMTAVRVQDLEVVLRQEHHGVRSLREYAIRRARGERLHVTERVRVLTNVSFSVASGRTLAIIGANGAGKTTLLRVLAGIIPPSGGRVVVDGRVAPLIELGAGFDPELTGVENVMLFGSLLGMKVSELRRQVDGIAEFADLTDVLDVPLKHYSTGMAARLGFAVATAVGPSVLLVDEVLAVGDESFRSRCAARLRELRGQGTAVVLVSHDLGLVRREADECLLLERGSVGAAGSANEVITAYERSVVP